jgi:DNA-binding NarL/FixJ family response regulator
VETYRNQLVTKFGARNAVDLVRRAVEAGFVLP